MPHSRIQVDLGCILQAGTCQILNFAQHPRQSQSVQGTELNLGGGHRTEEVYTGGGGTPHIFSEQGANRGGGGTLHIKTVSQYKLQVRLTAGWVAGAVPVILVHLAS